ncbi:neutral amino acid [Moniliophthora roreri]|nr:neutral amino acid [Moniliophthora roreri]
MEPAVKRSRSNSVQQDSKSDDVEKNDVSSLEDSSTTAALLFSEYICLAILSFPWSFSILGLVPGIIVTLVVAATVLYTSLILWRYCMKHPDIRDVCDIGRKLFGGATWAYNVTAVFFILNNTFIQALHVLVGARLLNTLSNSAQCTVVFAVISAIVCFLISLPRTLRELAHLGTFSAVTMGIAVLLAIIFAGIQEHPFGYVEGDEPIVTVIALPGTTYVAGEHVGILEHFVHFHRTNYSAFSLWAVTIAEIIVFTLCGALVYHYVGNQYMESPGFGSLQEPYKKIAFSFAIPTIVFLGSLYSAVSARFIFFRIFEKSRHRHSNTIIGWAVWVGILAATWIVAFVIAEVIPFFSDMLSLMSSLFDGWFG